MRNKSTLQFVFLSFALLYFYWSTVCCLSGRSPITLSSLLIFSCPYLHRVAGDVERRYHLRYYKTATCVHETDARGYCVKNGPHCAFAHGPHDLRQPVYDVRELQGTDKEEIDVLQVAGVDSRAAIEDARWQGLFMINCGYFAFCTILLHTIRNQKCILGAVRLLWSNVALFSTVK